MINICNARWLNSKGTAWLRKEAGSTGLCPGLLHHPARDVNAHDSVGRTALRLDDEQARPTAKTQHILRACHIAISYQSCGSLRNMRVVVRMGGSVGVVGRGELLGISYSCASLDRCQLSSDLVCVHAAALGVGAAKTELMTHGREKNPRCSQLLRAPC